MKIFEYFSQNDERPPHNDQIMITHSNRSKFDKLLIQEWNNAMDNGQFKFKIDSNLLTRYINGKYSFLVQENKKRYSEKRQSDLNIETLNLPFDMNKFNFTKINKNEILFKLVKRDSDLNENLPTISNKSNKDDLIIINNSPIEYGHVLILPDINLHSNQVLTKYAINLAIEVAHLSHSREILIGFNSLNAYSSVNHLHLHCYYLDNNKVINQRLTQTNLRALPIQNVESVDKLTKNLWSLDNNYYMPGFVLQQCDFNDRSEFINKIFTITNYFHQNEIAHNLVMVKAKPFGTSNNSISNDTLRVNIWPRKSSQNIPDYTQNERKIGIAICELAGQFIVQSDDDFNGLSEEWLEMLAEQVQLSHEEMTLIKNDLKKIFES